MGIQMTAQEVLREIRTAPRAEDLTAVLSDICPRMGFDYFALTHHADVTQAPARIVRLHNYPSRWVAHYDGNGFGTSDPVHRASQGSCVGFLWSEIWRMIPLTGSDHRILALGRENGIGNGFTVPVHVPGELPGSCTFANTSGDPIDEAKLPLAHLVGMFAFERARQFGGIRPFEQKPPQLTDRQRDCLIWAGRGKSDWEIGRILGISEDTVDRHLTNARERYGVPKRTMMIVRALFDGTVSFSDILPL